MKKVLVFAALFSVALFSCTKPGGDRTDGGKNNEGGEGKETEKVIPQTAKENLVLWVSFDEDKLVEVGEGVTLGENKGKVALNKGFIGNAWTNTGGDNTSNTGGSNNTGGDDNGDNGGDDDDDGLDKD